MNGNYDPVSNPRKITYRLTVTVQGLARNVYTMAGTVSSPLAFPPAYQTPPPFGVDLGGVNAGFFSRENGGMVAARDGVLAGEFDSWLTVGMTDASNPGALSSIGIDFDSWSDQQALQTTNGAVFWMDPDAGPSTMEGAVVVAQLTVREDASFTATMHMQGRSLFGQDWQEDVVFRL